MAYKLKKKYPTLPQCWEEGMIVTLQKTYYRPVVDKYRKSYLYIFDVENNPEYWEEVSEKDYEITAITFYSNTIHPILKGKFNGYLADEVLSDNRNNIYSVKRISDNKIFKVGDITEQGKILDFDFPGSDKSRCRYKIELEVLGGNWRMLSEAKKIVKVSLGTTKDTDEPVYENDKVFLLTCNWTCPEVVMTKKEYFKTPPMLFKTKENAQEYIVKNKPCLSYNEVLKGLNASGSMVTHVGGIMKIVEDKLKLDNGS